MKTNRKLEALVKKAARLSQKTRISSYYGAPAWDLTEKEIQKHYPARLACNEAYLALNEVGDPRATEFQEATRLHSNVVNRRGCPC